MTKWIVLFLALILSPVLYAKGKHRHSGPPPLEVVKDLNVNKFLGTWYEIARFPSTSGRECDNSIAQYNRGADGAIQMLNICRHPESGKVFETSGVAQFSDLHLGAKMKVSYLPHWMQWTGFGEGQYWVIDIAPDYSYAVVSEPGRRFVWILSRTPSIDKETYDKIGRHLLAQNFTPERLVASRPNSVTAR